jgi:hypothetical protein
MDRSGLVHDIMKFHPIGKRNTELSMKRPLDSNIEIGSCHEKLILEIMKMMKISASLLLYQVNLLSSSSLFLSEPQTNLGCHKLIKKVRERERIVIR